VPALIEALEDENETVRWYAAEALDRLNTPEAQNALKEYENEKK
jgi:HEAT repeat protein